MLKGRVWGAQLPSLSLSIHAAEPAAMSQMGRERLVAQRTILAVRMASTVAPDPGPSQRGEGVERGQRRHARRRPLAQPRQAGVSCHRSRETTSDSAIPIR